MGREPPPPRGRRRAAVPVARFETIRESLRRALEDHPATAKDLSREVGIPERDVAGHLEHLARSLSSAGSKLDVEPSRCLDCDFVFEGRTRLGRPGRCPDCHGRRISLPVFSIEVSRKGR